jgi:hypothetical protein
MPTSQFNLINSAKFLCTGTGAMNVVEVSKNGFHQNHHSDLPSTAADSTNGSFHYSPALTGRLAHESNHPVTTPPTTGITWYRVCQRDADFLCRRARLRLRAVAEDLAQSSEDKKVFPFQRFRILRLFCNYIAQRTQSSRR